MREKKIKNYILQPFYTNDQIGSICIDDISKLSSSRTKNNCDHNDLQTENSDFSPSSKEIRNNLNLDEHPSSFANLSTDKTQDRLSLILKFKENENENEKHCNLCKSNNTSNKLVLNSREKNSNFNDSAILSFSIASSNSNQIINNNKTSDLNRLNRKFDVDPKQNDLDNEDYYYCYSAKPNNEISLNKNTTFEAENLLADKCLKTEPRRHIKSKKKTKISNSSSNMKKSGCFCCCPKKLTNNKICMFFTFLNVKLKCFVDSKLFQRAILFAILINTLSMGIEHHEQVNISY